MELQSGIANYDCMASIVATLEANSPSLLRGELVYRLTFTFVAPLDSEHDRRRHRSNVLYGGCMKPLVGQ